jgi:hypothetical protein
MPILIFALTLTYASYSSATATTPTLFTAQSILAKPPGAYHGFPSLDDQEHSQDWGSLACGHEQARKRELHYKHEGEYHEQQRAMGEGRKQKKSVWSTTFVFSTSALDGPPYYR